MTEKLGYIVCIETYREDGFDQVAYARKDGEAVRELFLQVFKIPQENLFTFYDSKATRAQIVDSLSYQLRQPEPFEFYFYYAGHGLYSHGQNWLAVFDSHPLHIPNTALALKRDVMDRLGGADRAVLFLDTCSSHPAQTKEPLDDLQFIQRDQPACTSSAVYVSSSPGEGAVGCSKLEQGVWTSSLIKGLSDYSPATDAAGNVTDSSLRDYLASAVSQHFDTCSEHIRGRKQTPQAFLRGTQKFTLTRPKSRPPSPDESLAREDALISAFEKYQTAAESVARASGIPFRRDDLFAPVLGNVFGDHYLSKALRRVNEARIARDQIAEERGFRPETSESYKFIAGEKVKNEALPSLTNFLNFVVERFRRHPYSQNFIKPLRDRYLSWIKPELQCVRIIHNEGITYLETQLQGTGRDVKLERLALDFIDNFMFNPDTAADEVARYLLETFDVYSLLMTGVAEMLFTGQACDEAARMTGADGESDPSETSWYCHPECVLPDYR